MFQIYRKACQSPKKHIIPHLPTASNSSFTRTRKVNHECILFPSYAFRDPKNVNDWSIRIKGWTYSLKKPGPKQKILKGLTKSVAGKCSNNEISNEMFEHRFKYFLAHGRKNRKIRVEAIGDMSFDEWEKYASFLTGNSNISGLSSKEDALLGSDSGGVFTGQLHVKGSQLKSWTLDKAVKMVKIKVESVDTKGCAPSYGAVQMIEPKGISVISDIDDTIKETHVLSGARAVLTATFFNPTRAIDSMATVYTRWYNSGAAFHYVSSSPIQLTHTLKQFIRNHHFPPGSFHLRPSRGLLSKVIETSKKAKYESICGILSDFPQRKFILVGDSSELDLEIYTQVAQEFPGQILSIFIRDVTTYQEKERTRRQSFNISLPLFFTSNNASISTGTKRRPTSEIIKSNKEEVVSHIEAEDGSDDSVQDAAAELVGIVLESSLTGHTIGETIHSMAEGQLRIQDLTKHVSESTAARLKTKIEEAQKRLKTTNIHLFRDGKDLLFTVSDYSNDTAKIEGA